VTTTEKYYVHLDRKVDAIRSAAEMAMPGYRVNSVAGQKGGAV
jgi:hypothetical protein